MPYETEQTVGPGGVLNLDDLPFAEGQAVRVRIEPTSASATEKSPRVLGLHQGSVWMSDDFDAPLPDAFWLGADGGNEAPA